MAPPRLVMVTWIDAYTRGDWRKAGQSVDEAVCRSVGWITAESETCIEVAGTTADDDDGETHTNNTVTIPRGMIKRIQRLALPRSRK